MDANQDPKWLAYLYHRHSQTELTDWTRQLRFFRFCRAIGGHANDGDELLCAVRCADDAARAALFGALGLSQTGRVVLAGVTVFCSVRLGRLELSLFGAAGDPYEVTQADVDNALRVEPLLEPHAANILVPPRAGEHCFSPPV